MQAIVYDTERQVLSLKRLASIVYVSEKMNYILGSEFKRMYDNISYIHQNVNREDIALLTVEVAIKCILRTAVTAIHSGNISNILNSISQGTPFSSLMSLDVTDVDSFLSSNTEGLRLEILEDVNRITSRYVDAMNHIDNQGFFEAFANIIMLISNQYQSTYRPNCFRLELYGNRLNPLVLTQTFQERENHVTPFLPY